MTNGFEFKKLSPELLRKQKEVSREEWKIMPNQEITGLALFFCAKILIFS